MTELEMTKLCAQAMEWQQTGHPLDVPFDPLHDDAQAMALVKRFNLEIWQGKRAAKESPAAWYCRIHSTRPVWSNTPGHRDLNNAVVECVAKMQERK